MAADEGERGMFGLWQVVGRLEVNVDRLVEGQANLRADLKATNARIDRLLYAIIGLTMGIVAAVVVQAVT